MTIFQHFWIRCTKNRGCNFVKKFTYIENLGVLAANSSHTNHVPIEHGPPMAEGTNEQGKTEYTLAWEKNNHDASEGALCLLHLSASARPGDATIPSGITSTVKSTPKTRSDSFSSNQSFHYPKLDEGLIFPKRK